VCVENIQFHYQNAITQYVLGEEVSSHSGVSQEELLSSIIPFNPVFSRDMSQEQQIPNSCQKK
jgi:hypothetical protein